MDKNTVILSDLVDFEYLQHLQDSFAAVAQITSVVVDPNGMPLTVPSNLYGFCGIMQTHEKTLPKCICANTELIRVNVETKKPAVVTCPNSGLITASVPIFIDDKLLGCWILGQVRIDDPTDNVYEVTSADTGISVKELKDIMLSLPVVTREKFEYIFNYLTYLSEALIKLAQAGSEAMKQNAILTKLTQELQHTEKMLTVFSDSANVAMYVCDFETREILMANEKMSFFTGISKDELLNKESSFCLIDNKSNIFSYDKEKVLEQKFQSDDIFINEKNMWWQRTVQLIHWVDNRLAVMVTFSDISKERYMQGKLEYLAYYDSNLKLPNLLKLEKDLNSIEGNENYIITFDLKEFRRINDAYGRKIGDILLNLIVDWLHEYTGVNISDIYRVGSDEFSLLLKNASAYEARQLADLILNRFKDSWLIKIEEETVYVPCDIYISIVYCNIPSLEENESLTNIIDRSMDMSRNQNEIVFYDEKVNLQFKENLALELSLKKAVSNNLQGFDVHYQPIVCAKTGKWVGLEALCRFTSEEFGIIRPDIFIREAERLGLIEPIGQWILETSVAQCKAWGLDEIEDFVLEVNFSPIQIANANLEKNVLEVLRKYDFPGSSLCIEITESQELTLSPYVQNAISNLRKESISVALDDFGVGYSSFHSLRNLPVNTLKTERVFLQNIENDSYLLNLFRIIGELAHVANKKLIAEGVETKTQLSLVIQNGADYIQGYYFSKPLPKAELEKLLHKFKEVDLINFPSNNG